MAGSQPPITIFRSTDLPVLEQFDFYLPRVRGQPYDQTISGGSQTGKFPKAFKRPYQQTVTDLGNLGAHRASTGRQGTEQLSFDNFSAWFDTKQVFDAAIECPRELQRYRSGGRVLIRLERTDRLSRYSREIR